MTVFDTTPSILRETSRGLERTSIYDELLRERTLVLSGEVEPAMASTLCQHVLFLEREDPSSPITLFVSSPGGQVGPGLAIYDVLRSVSCLVPVSSHAKPRPSS